MCDNCKQINCGCKEPDLCGCAIKLPFECTTYTGVTLQPLGIESQMDGNMVIKLINDYVKNFVDNLEIDPTLLTNIGGKVEIYKGLSSTFEHEIKTIQGTQGIIVESLDDPATSYHNGGEFINVKIDTDWLDEYICERIQACGVIPPQPHIIGTSDIVINLSNGASYTFGAQDFVNHFTDSYVSHTLEEVRLTGDVTNITFQGNAYVAGTWIPLTDITGLVFTSPVQNGTYTVTIPWDGKDNLGNISN